jgi:4-amino-4-deoxy-L-arabinose transferase-like glycosyltransferase
VGLSSIYFATASGITSSNDGSHYALTRTMVENRSFALRQFDDFAEGNDIAVRDGIVYSDRPPGTAVISTIFYTLGSLLPDPLSTLPSRHDAENPRLMYVLLLPVFSGAGTTVLLYLFLRENGVSLAGALTAVLMFGLGTIHWKYSSVLFSHALSGFLVMLSILLAARFLPTQKRSRWKYFFLLGLILGLSVLVEYANGLFVILALLFVLVREWPTSARQFLATFGLLALGGMISAVFLGIYNQANFGSPFTLSYAYAVNYPWAGDFRTTFSWPLLPGLEALLIGGEGGGWCDPTCYNQGLFLLSPILLLALPGFSLYYRRARQPFLLTTAIFLAYLLLFAKHFTFHGFTGDGRYLTPFLPLFAIPLAYSLEWLFNQSRHPAWQTALLFITFGLFFLSVRSMLLHIGFSFNYHLDLSQLDPMIASPQNWRYLVSTLFPNTGNLLLLWLLEGFGVLIWFSGHRIRNLSTK